jgi:large subunit ribosomal protein L7/L12
MAANMQEKLIQDISNMTVLELADLVKALEEKFGVSASAMATASAAPSAAAAPVAAVEEKSEYKVTLKEAGDDSKKIAVIKALRKVVPALNLTDAKKMVESTPAVVLEAASKDDAKKIKEELEAAGAKVELS